MQAEVAGAAGAADGADLLLSTASDTEAFYGRLRKARDLSQQAVESAKRCGAREAAALSRFLGMPEKRMQSSNPCGDKNVLEAEE